MARPRKYDTEDMIKIVNTFFEENGNPSMLKCSILEKYAQSIGIDLKAYDFRRNTKVRKLMEELTGSISKYGQGGQAFKSLDIDAFIQNHTSVESMRKSLIELNSAWKDVYDNSMTISKKNKALLSELNQCKKELSNVLEDINSVKSELKHLQALKNRLVVENNYLKRMIKENLYPAVANEILKSECEWFDSNTSVSKSTMDNFTEKNQPITFSEAVKADRGRQSESEIIVEKMMKQVKNNAKK